MILLDSRAGSWQLALYEPIRSMLDVCSVCRGLDLTHSCSNCSFKCKDGSFIYIGRELPELSSGDFCFNSGNDPDTLIGVEIKFIDDLIDSISTGRLQGMNGQLEDMLSDYDETWLLIHGDFRPSPRDNNTLQVYREERKNRFGIITRKPGYYDYEIKSKPVPYGYPQAFLVSPYMAGLGINIARVRDLQEAAVWLGVLYRSRTRKSTDHKSFRTVNKSNKVIPVTQGLTVQEKLAISNAMDWPGIGFEKAYALATHFGSVRAMVNASVHEIAEVVVISQSGRSAKIGMTIAKAIKSALGG